MLKLFPIAFVTVVLTTTSYGQLTTVSGTVYDITKKNPIEAVSVISTSGRGTTTDSLGRYSLIVHENDSIYFSYLNRATPKYAVRNIPNLAGFDISILQKVRELPMVYIKQRNYKLDSLQNREDYAKIFNWEKPGVGVSMNDGVAGLDLDAFINMFSFAKNKRMASFQRRLIQEEQDRYTNHRFSKGLVKKLTGLNPPEIDSFMKEFRPTLQMVQQFNDLELGQYVVEAYKYYKAGVKVDRSLLNQYNFRLEQQY